MLSVNFCGATLYSECHQSFGTRTLSVRSRFAPDDWQPGNSLTCLTGRLTGHVSDYPVNRLIRTYFVQNSFYSKDKHSGLAVRNEVLLHYVIQRRLTTTDNSGSNPDRPEFLYQLF